MKIVINTCYGGFSVSEKAAELMHLTEDDTLGRGMQRNNPLLVSVVEHLGEDSWGPFAELKVVEIPDDVEWTIEEYDGREWIAEKHRTWN